MRTMRGGDTRWRRGGGERGRGRRYGELMARCLMKGPQKVATTWDKKGGEGWKGRNRFTFTETHIRARRENSEETRGGAT